MCRVHAVRTALLTLVLLGCHQPVLAWDDQAADIVAHAWAAADTPTRADTIVVVTVTSGEDQFIYTNH